MCYSNFIGLSKKCNLPAPSSGLYIDSLEGISTKSVANIAMGDAISAQALINEKLELVFANLEANAGSFLFDEVVNHSVDSVIGTEFDETVEDASSNERGLVITKRRGKLTKLNLQRIYLKSETDVEGLEVTITDGGTEEVLTVDLLANIEKVIEVNFATLSNSITVSYQNEDLTPYTGDATGFSKYWFQGCNTCGCHGLKVEPFDGDNSISEYIGLRVDASVECDRSKMVCLIAENQKVAILYLLGSEILKEHVSSDRVNFLAINKEWADKTKDIWEKKAYELLYQNSQGIKRYLTSHEKECFICNSIRNGYSLP